MPTFNAPFRDKNSERYMHFRKIEKAINMLKNQYLITDSEDLDNIYFCEGQAPVSQKDEGDWRPFSKDERWGSREYYCRFKHSFDVPERFKGGNLYYEIMPVEAQAWDDTSAQFIIFANDKLLQGCDLWHNSVLLLDKAKGGEHYDMHMNAYLDDFAFKGQRVFRARIKQTDPVVWKLIFDLETPLRVTKNYGPDDMERVNILKALNEAVNMIDFEYEDRKDFINSAKQAMDHLEANIYGKFTVDAYTSCIGHTHIDVAWLWRLRQTREKTGRSFATVLKLMEEYPEYKFMSSQAQLYAYVKEDYPEVYEGIKKMVKSGRWEVEGGMWVEPDTNVPSGESLARQFIVGKRFFKQEFGIDSKIMWEPDVFGYSAALPQIMKKSGIEYFMTTKISWNEYNRVPYDTFIWKGIDGTGVLSHFSPSRSGYDDDHSFMTTYNSFLSPEEIIGGWQRYSNKDLNNNVLCTYGYGDGGGGPTKEMLEYGKRMNKGIEGCPKVEFESSLDFYKRLEKEVGESKNLQTWVGELYLEFHRGTLTSQADNKKNNRKSEILLHDVETLATLANIKLQEEYPRDDFTEDWKTILLHQFHDILPGSSIKEVYMDSDEDYNRLFALEGTRIQNIIGNVASNIKAQGKSLVVFNTLGTCRDDVVITDLPTGKDFSILDENGKAMRYQKTHDGKLCFLAEKVPAKGYKTFTVFDGEGAEYKPMKATAKAFENDFFSVKFDKNMNIKNCLHKASGREVAPEGKFINQLVAYDDRPFDHEAWDVKAYFDQKYWLVDDVQSAELVENGAVRAVYKVIRKFRKSTITEYIIAYTTNDRIDVTLDVDWQESNTLLKVENIVDVNASKATFDIQFGNIERTTHNNTLWDFAQFEVMGHKWIDLSDNGFGFSLLNDSKYGHHVKNGKVATSLLRSQMRPCVDQDKGNHVIKVALYPHCGAVSQSDVVKQGYSLNFPMHCVLTDTHDGSLPTSFSLASVNKPNIIIETLKTAEDSDEMVIRMYETWNQKTDCTLSVCGEIEQAHETNLLEENEQKLFAEGNSIKLSFKPFELKTVKIKL